MRKFYLKTMLLLCALVVGTSMSWADTYSLTPDQTSTGSSATAYITTLTEFTYGGVTWEMNQWNPKTLQIKTNQGSAANEFRFYNTSAFAGKITQVVITFSALTVSDASKLMFIGGSSKVTETTGGTAGTWNGTDKTLTWTPGGSDNFTYFAFYQNGKAASGTNYLASTDAIVVTYETGAAAVATPTFSVDAGAYTSTQSVELECATDGATIYYTLDGTTPSGSSTEYTSAISVSETKTIKAIAIKGSDESLVASATYTIYPVLHAGTELDPYTVADARNAIDANTGLTGVYVSGIVCEGGSELSDGAMNYWISDDGTETNKFEIYKGKGISGASFTATTDVKVGDVVVVTGDIKKFSSTYEFSSGSQLVSLDRPTTPVIAVTPSSLTDFTYEVSSGPSDAQTFSVEGSNLTENISLSLDVSNYEVSLSESSGYTSSLTFTQAAGSVAATTVYVRLKAGLAVNASYEGTITLTSTGATTKNISLTGSVTQPNFTWDLSTNSYSAASEDQVTWPGTYATMVVDKAKSTTNANNYLPTTRTSSRFYTNSILTITPATGYAITSVVFTATSADYATALAGSTWTNATAAASDKTVTVTPTNDLFAISATIGATCGFTAVKVYYEAATTATVTLNSSGYATFACLHPLDFSDDSEYSAWQITEANSSTGVLTFSQITGTVAAGTGVLLKGTASASINIPVTTSGSDISASNLLEGITSSTAVSAGNYYGLKGNQFVPVAASTVPAGKALLPVANVGAAKEFVFEFNFEDDDATGIEKVQEVQEVQGAIYNLAGQRLQKMQKGINIVNGKKVLY